MSAGRIVLCWILTFLVFSAVGCAIYSFSGSSLPSHIKTVAIPIFENETLEYAVANEVTDAITNRFLKDGRLKVTGETRANALLEGRITSYENKVNNYSADGTPLDYVVVLRVAVLFRDAVKNQEVWKEDGFVLSAVYSAGGDSDEPLKDETSARASAISELAEYVLARTMEQW